MNSTKIPKGMQVRSLSFIIKLYSNVSFIIDKGILSKGLLATILVDKFVHHLPLYLQKQWFSRENIDTSFTLEVWAVQSMDAFKPLYEKLVMDIKNEVPIPVKLYTLFWCKLYSLDYNQVYSLDQNIQY
jgi:hypothetical protein